MRRNHEGERLLILTLNLEAAVETEDWPAVDQLIQSRNAAIESCATLSKSLQTEIAAADERILTSLRRRLNGVRADMRNLGAALRIASSYAREPRRDGLSLAG
jgi:hypothetical protein